MITQALRQELYQGARDRKFIHPADHIGLASHVDNKADLHATCKSDDSETRLRRWTVGTSLINP